MTAGFTSGRGEFLTPFRWRRFQIVRRLGRGAFGDVYLAHDQVLERHVALKLLTAPGSSAVEGERVVREAELLSRVRHRNVVEIHGAAIDSGHVGIWMEAIDGLTLEDILVERGPLSTTEAAQIGVELCDALTAVHRAGILHRDIKTANVMRSRGGRCVLMDFGAARLGHTAEGLLGTPLFMAPELLQMGAASVASEIYSLGVVLFRLLSNSYPIEGQTLEALRHAHVHRRVSVPVRLPKVPRELAGIIERALAHDPRDRWPSPDALGQALTSFLASSSSSLADPPMRLRRASGPVLATAVAGVGIMITAGIWFSRQNSGQAPVAAAPDSPATTARVVDAAEELAAASRRGECSASLALHRSAADLNSQVYGEDAPRTLWAGSKVAWRSAECGLSNPAGGTLIASQLDDRQRRPPDHPYVENMASVLAMIATAQKDTRKAASLTGTANAVHIGWMARAGWTGTLTPPSSLDPNLLIAHVGDTDPRREGFSAKDRVAGRAGEAGWEVTSGLYRSFYERLLSETEIGRAFARGWRLAARVDVSSGYVAVSVDGGLAHSRYFVEIGRRQDRHYTVTARSNNDRSLDTSHQAGTTPPLVELVWDPAVRSAHMIIDGVTRTTGYQGHFGQRTGRTLEFGFPAQEGPVTATFSLVHFQIR